MAGRSDFAIILMCMPWAACARPSLGLGILAACLRSEGFQCDVVYPNLFFSGIMGCNGYEYIASTPTLFGAAEHLFATDIFGNAALRSDEYLNSFNSITGSASGNPTELHHGLFELRDKLVPGFLDAFAADIARRKPDLIGFTCTFNQVMPSVALARRIKSADPRIKIVLGGPCVHGQMGVSYSRIFHEYIDAVFLGEADAALIQYARSLSAGGPTNHVPGIASGGVGEQGGLFADFDRLPTPDYSDYFRSRVQLEAESFKLFPFHSLPFEASRGCWWGQKQHCTFCGLNNEGMKYRRKTVHQVVNELTEMAMKYQVSRFMAADNILDYRAYRDLLPALAALPWDMDLFFEIKTNAHRTDVELLAKAGVHWAQPGIESFSDHVLALMRKGASVLQNVQTLKWLCEYGIKVSYNLLVGFPGETKEDYLEMLDILQKLRHLPPPGDMALIVEVQRFAPFHFDSDAMGIGPIRAAKYYDYLIPSHLAPREDYAYFFDRDLPPDFAIHSFLGAVNESLREWCESRWQPRLRLGAGVVELVTGSAGTESSTVLDSVSSALMVLTDCALPESSVIEQLEGSATREQICRAIGNLDRKKFLLRHRGKLLSLIPFEKPQSDHRLKLWLRRWHGLFADSPSTRSSGESQEMKSG